MSGAVLAAALLCSCSQNILFYEDTVPDWYTQTKNQAGKELFETTKDKARMLKDILNKIHITIHPNIANIIDVHVDDQYYYIVEEYVEGVLL